MKGERAELLPNEGDFKLPNPKGIPAQSPWLRQSRYHGSSVTKTSPTPKELRPKPQPASGSHNPFGVASIKPYLPNVARASQRWAVGHNPFGIEKPFSQQADKLAICHNPAVLCRDPAKSKLSWAMLLAIATSLSLSARAAGPEEAVKVPMLRPAHAEILPSFWEQYGLWVVLAGLVVIGLAAFVVWLLTRPQAPVVIPPEVQARQALGALPAQATDGATLSRISQILRHYVRRTFELPPVELNTTEFCQVLANHPKIGLALALALGEFLRDNDVRKFSPASLTLPAVSPVTQALALIDKCEARRADLAGQSTASPQPADQPA